jgi:hypothetical protein
MVVVVAVVVEYVVVDCSVGPRQSSWAESQLPVDTDTATHVPASGFQHGVVVKPSAPKF